MTTPLARKAFAATLSSDPELKKLFFSEIKKQGPSASHTFDTRMGVYAAAVVKRYGMDKPLYEWSDVENGLHLSEFDERLRQVPEVAKKKGE